MWHGPSLGGWVGNFAGHMQEGLSPGLGVGQSQVFLN